ncbi:MAG: hypothetical protein ACI8W8_000063 [Rhodothermales bacterium]|jgi:hypothetical protein
MSSCSRHPEAPAAGLCQACSAAICQDCVTRNNGFCSVDCYEAVKGAVGYEAKDDVVSKREAMELLISRVKLGCKVVFGLLILGGIYLGLRFGYTTRWHPYARVAWQVTPATPGPTYILTADETRIIARVSDVMMAVEPVTGAELWRLPIEDEFTTMDIEKDGFFFANAKRAIRLNRDGKELWRVEMGGNRRYIGSGKDVLLFWESGMYKRKVAHYDWQTEARMMERGKKAPPPGAWEPLLSTDDIEQENKRMMDARWQSASRDHFLVGVNRNTGEDLWAAPLDDDVEVARVAIRDPIGIMGITRWKDEKAAARQVIAFNPRDGKHLWHKTYNKSFDGPGFDDDGNILVHFTYESKLYDPQGKELPAPKREIEIRLGDEVDLSYGWEEDRDYAAVAPLERYAENQYLGGEEQAEEDAGEEGDDEEGDEDDSHLGDYAESRWEEPSYVFNDYSEREAEDLVITRKHELNLLTEDRRGVVWTYGLGGGVTQFADAENVVVITGHNSQIGMHSEEIADRANMIAGGDADLAGYIAGSAVMNDWILAGLERSTGKVIWEKEGVAGRIFPHNDSFVLLEDTLEVNTAARARNEAGLTILSQYRLKDGKRIFRRSLEDMAIMYPRILRGQLIGIATQRTGQMTTEYGNFFELLNADAPQALGIVAITLK